MHQLGIQPSFIILKTKYSFIGLTPDKEDAELLSWDEKTRNLFFVLSFGSDYRFIASKASTITISFPFYFIEAINNNSSSNNNNINSCYNNQLNNNINHNNINILTKTTAKNNN